MTTVRPLNYRINNHSLFRYLISFCMITSVWNNTSLLERSQGIFMYPSHCCMDCCWQVTKSNNYYQAKKKKACLLFSLQIDYNSTEQGMWKKALGARGIWNTWFWACNPIQVAEGPCHLLHGMQGRSSRAVHAPGSFSMKTVFKRAARLLWFCLSPHMLVVLCLFDAVCTCEGIEPNCNLSFVCI